jgi:hypothetical protein
MNRKVVLSVEPFYIMDPRENNFMLFKFYVWMENKYLKKTLTMIKVNGCMVWVCHVKGYKISIHH